jgi:hypothetical protein
MPLLEGSILDSPWSHEFRNPQHAHKDHKPLVDLGHIHSNMVEKHWFKSNGRGKATDFVGIWSWNAPWHWVQHPEEGGAYTQSYSTRECCYAWYGITMAWWLNYHAGKYSAGNVNSFNPRTRWAHTVVFWMGLTRLHLAFLVGICGYFYSYEFLYTYVPPFKIRDPSPEGWKRCIDDGQSTFLARMVACIFPGLGTAIWRGSWKKSYIMAGFCCSHSIWYEFCRPFFMGSVLAMNYQNGLTNDRDGRLGNLMPELERRIDPDTDRAFWVSTRPFIRLAHGRAYDPDTPDAVVHMGHDYLPFREMNLQIRSPYYNWQKASQEFKDSPMRYKSQTFKLPNPLEARVLSGAMDRHDSGNPAWPHRWHEGNVGYPQFSPNY